MIMDKELKTKVSTALVGSGNVSLRYLKFLKDSPIIDLVACADKDANAAKARANEFRIPKGITFKEVLKDPTIDLVLNLTSHSSHYKVSSKALEAGKYVYSEKPMAVTFNEGQALMSLAKENGVRLACAPDTFLGPNIQTARLLLDRGDIGTPRAFSGSYGDPGPNLWHPNPESFFKLGGGPIYDEGPYFLTALVSLLGPVEYVSAQGSTFQKTRQIHQGPKAGKTFPVEAITHMDSLLQFASGVYGSLTLSFEIMGSNRPPLEIYGSTGSLRIAFPGYYDIGERKMLLGRQHDGHWEEVKPLWPNIGDARGIGVEEFAESIQNRQPSRMDAELALHVLEVLDLMQKSMKTGQRQKLSTKIKRPAPLTSRPRALSPIL